MWRYYIHLRGGVVLDINLLRSCLLLSTVPGFMSIYNLNSEILVDPSRTSWSKVAGPNLVKSKILSKALLPSHKYYPSSYRFTYCFEFFKLIKTPVHKIKTATPAPLVVIARENTDVISGNEAQLEGASTGSRGSAYRVLLTR